MDTSGPRLRSATSSVSSRNSGSSGSGSRNSAQEYIKLSQTEDDDDEDVIDDLPYPTTMKYNTAYASGGPTACPQCCFLFSFAGIVFLSTIAFLLMSDSPYIKISAATDDKKVELADSVWGAVYIYMFTFVVSAVIIFKSKGVQRARIDDRTYL